MCFISYFILYINEQLIFQNLKSFLQRVCQYLFQLHRIKFASNQSNIIPYASAFYIFNVVYWYNVLLIP